MTRFGRLLAMALSAAGLCAAAALPDTSPADLLHPLSARGINCEGNSACQSGGTPGVPKGTSLALSMYQNMIASVPDSFTYTEGQQFMCTTLSGNFNAGLQGFCGFLQKTGSTPVNAHFIKQALLDIQNHGCGRCGSAPFRDGPGGFITINWTEHVSCGGLAQSGQYGICKHCNGGTCVGKFLGPIPT